MARALQNLTERSSSNGRRRPLLPAFIDWLEIRRLLVGTARVDVRLVRHPEDVGVTVLNPSSGVEVIIIK